MTPNGKTKENKGNAEFTALVNRRKAVAELARQAANLAPGWDEGLKLHEIEYIKQDIEEMDQLSKLLWLKIVKSVTPEVREMLFARNGIERMYDATHPYNVIEGLAGNMEAVHTYSLDAVRDHLDRARRLVLGFDEKALWNEVRAAEGK